VTIDDDNIMALAAMLTSEIDPQKQNKELGDEIYSKAFEYYYSVCYGIYRFGREIS
jgi:hypothetical protein